MPYALMTSGGKDSTLALDRARRAGLDVQLLAAMYDGTSGRVRYHGLRKQLLIEQAKAIGIELVAAPTPVHAFEPVFHDLLDMLKRRGITGVVFGNVHLADIRDWYEQRVRAAGLEHVEPLWGDPSVEVAWEVVERGYRALVISVNLDMSAVGHLGKELDADLVTEISCSDDLDPGGERGEYHTFVFDGPEFRHPVGFTRGETIEAEGHRILDLLPMNGQLGAPVP